MCATHENYYSTSSSSTSQIMYKYLINRLYTLSHLQNKNYYLFRYHFISSLFYLFLCVLIFFYDSKRSHFLSTEKLLLFLNNLVFLLCFPTKLNSTVVSHQVVVSLRISIINSSIHKITYFSHLIQSFNWFYLLFIKLALLTEIFIRTSNKKQIYLFFLQVNSQLFHTFKNMHSSTTFWIAILYIPMICDDDVLKYSWG